MLPVQSLETLRTGLHLSASSLKTYLQCPQKFAYRYVFAAEPEFRPSALLLGRAVHEALAVHHRGIQDGSPVSPEQVTATFDDALRRELDHPLTVQYRDGENAEKLGTVGRALIGAYVYKLTILMHECCHRTLFRSRTINDRVGLVAGGFLVTSYDAFCRAHWQHHRHCGTDEDGEESDYLTLQDASPARLVLHLLKPLLGVQAALMTLGAVRAIVAHATGALGFARLEAPVFAWNPASMRVLEKCGFDREAVMRKSVFKDGELIDSVLYAKLAP